MKKEPPFLKALKSMPYLTRPHQAKPDRAIPSRAGPMENIITKWFLQVNDLRAKAY